MDGQGKWGWLVIFADRILGDVDRKRLRRSIKTVAIPFGIVIGVLSGIALVFALFLHGHWIAGMVVLLGGLFVGSVAMEYNNGFY